MLHVSSHSERPMRLVYRIALVIGVLIGSVALPSQNVANAESRRIPRWCASMGGDFGFDCSYDTFAQCMETARASETTACKIRVYRPATAQSGSSAAPATRP